MKTRFIPTNITTMHLQSYLYAEYVLGGMSASTRPDVTTAIEGCRPEDVTPVALDAETLESTAPEYLKDFKRQLAAEGLLPARVTVTACFDTDCSFSTQEKIDRIRGYVRAAAFLGASTITVEAESVSEVETVRPALAACAERAEREGLQFELDGPIDLA